MSGDITPGWYSAPDGTARYWDGTQWLAAVADSPQVSAPNEGETPLAVTDQAPSADGAPTAKRRGGKTALIASAAGLVVLGAGAALYFTGFIGGASNEQDAVSQCQKNVTSMLKSPSTAVFSEAEVNPAAGGIAYSAGLLLLKVLDIERGDPIEALDLLGEKNGESYASSRDQGIAKYGDRGGYFVNGYVDSQNGFGATVHTEYSCSYLEADGQWTSEVVSVAGSPSQPGFDNFLEWAKAGQD